MNALPRMVEQPVLLFVFTRAYGRKDRLLVGRAGSRQPRAPLQGQVFALVLRCNGQRFGAVCIQD